MDILFSVNIFSKACCTHMMVTALSLMSISLSIASTNQFGNVHEMNSGDPHFQDLNSVFFDLP